MPALQDSRAAAQRVLALQVQSGQLPFCTSTAPCNSHSMGKPAVWLSCFLCDLQVPRAVQWRAGTHRRVHRCSMPRPASCWPDLLHSAPCFSPPPVIDSAPSPMPAGLVWSGFRPSDDPSQARHACAASLGGTATVAAVGANWPPYWTGAMELRMAACMSHPLASPFRCPTAGVPHPRQHVCGGRAGACTGAEPAGVAGRDPVFVVCIGRHWWWVEPGRSSGHAAACEHAPFAVPT